MLSLSHEEIQTWKTPGNWRRFDGRGNQTYATQLWIRVDELLQLWLPEPKSIMDVWSFHSSAAWELWERLWGKIYTVWVDLQKPLDAVQLDEFIIWDLNDPSFLSQLQQHQAWKNIILMNNVSQYLSDRLGVIKFLFDQILSEWWVFYCNVLPEYFFVSPWFVPIQFIEALEEIWTNHNIKFTSQQTVFKLRAYKFIKQYSDEKLPIPTYWSSRIDRNWFMMTRYDLRDIQL